MFEDFYLNVELLNEDAKIPTRANDTDAGLDFYTPLDIIIRPQNDKLIPLDIKVEFPNGYALIVKEKSGIATKKKCSIGACVIDSEYRGNCMIHLFNFGYETVSFKKGDKIAQGIIVPIWTGQPKLVKKISVDTDRGEGGFGSTGK